MVSFVRHLAGLAVVLFGLLLAYAFGAGYLSPVSPPTPFNALGALAIAGAAVAIGVRVARLRSVARTG